MVRFARKFHSKKTGHSKENFLDFFFILKSANSTKTAKLSLWFTAFALEIILAIGLGFGYLLKVHFLEMPEEINSPDQDEMNKHPDLKHESLNVSRNHKMFKNDKEKLKNIKRLH